MQKAIVHFPVWWRS